MRKNYFVKLVNYLKNVYHIERGLNKLSDGRTNPTYSTGKVVMPVLFGFLLRIKSFNELSLMIKNHEFRQLFPRGTKLPQIDAIRDTLKVIDLDGLKQINHHIVKTAVENKAYENGTIDGYMVAAIDGTKFFGSNKKSCSECLKNTNADKTHCFTEINNIRSEQVPDPVRRAQLQQTLIQLNPRFVATGHGPCLKLSK